MRRFCLAVLCLLFLSFPTYGQFGKDLGLWTFKESTSQPVQKSVCRIGSNDSQGNFRTIGSGSVVAEGKILTAYHVVDGGQKQFVIKWVLLKKTTTARLVAFDEKHDLALLEGEIPEGADPIGLSDKVPELHDRVEIVGMSGDEWDKPRHFDGYSSSHHQKNDDIYQAFVVHGDSGSCILYEGKIVGVVQRMSFVIDKGYTYNDLGPYIRAGALCHSCSYELLKAFLQENLK